MKGRELYRDRKARGVCVDCEAPSNGMQLCIDCREVHRVYAANYNRRHPEINAARSKRLYHQDPEKFRTRARTKYLDKKLRGECQRCKEPAVEDSNYCAAHRDAIRAVNRAYIARKRNGEQLQEKTLKPRKAKRELLAAPCECGAEKHPGAVACDRCAHLEGVGRRDGAAAVIDALRGSDGMSIVELCDALGADTSKQNGRRQMWRWLKALLEQGRIRRYWHETSGDVTEMESYRGGTSTRAQAIGCWYYALDGKTEREWQANERAERRAA